jgi:hypothetical protein
MNDEYMKGINLNNNYLQSESGNSLYSESNNLNEIYSFNNKRNGNNNSEGSIRNLNNLLSRQNKILKVKIKELEKELINIAQTNPMKDELKNNIRDNELLAYKILNEAKDMYELKNGIKKMTSTYNEMRLSELDLEQILLNNQKNELKIKLNELKNKKNNLDILFNSALEKKKINEEMLSKVNDLNDYVNYRKNYINDYDEANKVIDNLLNEKHRLIEENIKNINFLQNNYNNKEYNNVNSFDINANKEALMILKNRNNKLKNTLNKYNNIINRTTIFLNNYNFKNNPKNKTFLNIDEEIIKVIDKNTNLNNMIDDLIKKSKIEFVQKDEIIENLQKQYIKSNEAPNSYENFIL